MVISNETDHRKIIDFTELINECDKSSNCDWNLVIQYNKYTNNYNKSNTYILLTILIIMCLLLWAILVTLYYYCRGRTHNSKENNQGMNDTKNSIESNPKCEGEPDYMANDYGKANNNQTKDWDSNVLMGYPK